MDSTSPQPEHVVVGEERGSLSGCPRGRPIGRAVDRPATVEKTSSARWLRQAVPPPGGCLQIIIQGKPRRAPVARIHRGNRLLSTGALKYYLQHSGRGMTEPSGTCCASGYRTGATHNHRPLELSLPAAFFQSLDHNCARPIQRPLPHNSIRTSSPAANCTIEIITWLSQGICHVIMIGRQHYYLWRYHAAARLAGMELV